MELRSYLEIIWRRKWILVITFVITVFFAAVGTFFITPTYTTSATIRLEPGGGNAGFEEIQYSDRLMNTYREIATTDPLIEEIERRLDVNELPEIDVVMPANTELMRIVAESQNPTLAAHVANILAELLITESRKAETRRSFVLSLVEPATVPTKTSQPKVELNIALGIVFGLAAGLGLVFLFENLDNKLYTTEQVEAATTSSIIGLIPVATEVKSSFMNGTSPEGEAFRRLRTNIFGAIHQNSQKTLLVTSAEPGEGKSTIVANLAYSVAQSGFSVVVIDGDLRLPTLHKIFNLKNEFGLSNVLNEEMRLSPALQSTHVPRVHVLTSGPLPSNPSEMLGSPQMTDIIEQLREQFDLVLIDTPAVLAVSDALVLASRVDNIFLVVGCAQASFKSVRTAQQQLASLSANSIGVVVNRAAQSKAYSYYLEAKSS
ncbi:MAG: polysaccharide biosynthesis tyrosine autokinase [Anaerolineae bacterium]|nr:polysaccharide biosynthesis tyrosine autokinase [Anaerolineae bacterium]